MTFHEYPKALYRSGEYLSVEDRKAEKAARADGWMDYYDDQRKMGTPKDGKEGMKPAPTPAPLPDTYNAPDYSARKG